MRTIAYSLLILLCVSARAETPDPFVSAYQQQEMQRLGFYQARANAGDAHAQFRIGWAYETGDGLPQDVNAASRWYQRAARQGHMNARLNLAVMDPDSGLDLDPAEKQFLDEFAGARSGQREARIAVARQAVLGEFNRPELVTIYSWLKELAREGDPQSQHLLATFYIQGRGVPQNFVHAYTWFSVAAATGHAPAMAGRDAVARLMSPAQIEQGQTLSMEYYEKYVEGLKHPELPHLDETGNVSQVE